MSIKSLVEAAVKVDLKDRPTQEAISHAWPDIYYSGDHIFNPYMDISNDVGQAIAKEWGSRPSDIQEVYLGYVPDKDIFITAWEGHFENEDYDPDDEENEHDEETEFAWAIVELKFKSGKFTITNRRLDYGRELFYSGGLRSVKRQYPKILDLRLD